MTTPCGLGLTAADRSYEPTRAESEGGLTEQRPAQVGGPASSSELVPMS